MYMYEYVNMYGYGYVCIHVYMYVYVWIRICMCICMYMCVYGCICVYMHVYVYTWICMDICVYVWMYVCRSVCICLDTDMCMYVCGCVCIWMCMHISLIQVAKYFISICTAAYRWEDSFTDQTPQNLPSELKGVAHIDTYTAISLTLYIRVQILIGKTTRRSHRTSITIRHVPIRYVPVIEKLGA